MRILALTLLAPLGAGGPTPAAAQDFLDRGTLVIARGGAEVAREEFAVRTAGGRPGQSGLLAVSTVRSRDREIQAALELDADHVPISFQETTTSAGRAVQRVTAQLSGIRFSARMTGRDGEVAREFPVRPPVALLSSEAFSQFAYVPRATAGTPRRITVILTDDPRALAGDVEALGPDTVVTAGRSLPAQHFVLRVPGLEDYHFWLSPDGDLLKVAVPGRDLVVTRSEPPGR